MKNHIMTILWQISTPFIIGLTWFCQIQNPSFKTFLNQYQTCRETKLNFRNFRNFSSNFLIVCWVYRALFSHKCRKFTVLQLFPLSLLCSYKNERNGIHNPVSPLQFFSIFYVYEKVEWKRFACRYLRNHWSYRSAVWGIWKESSRAQFFQLQVH